MLSETGSPTSLVITAPKSYSAPRKTGLVVRGLVVRSRLLSRCTGTILVALLCPLLTGCLAVGWAYPTASFVPAVSVGAAAQDVRAFRIDVKDDGPAWDGDIESDRYVMEEMTARFGDRLCPQGKLAVDYGWEGLSALSQGHTTHHTLLVRLYRSGYKTVEIESWELVSEATWIKATTLSARERAIDDLLSTFERDFSAHLRASTEQRKKEGNPNIERPRDRSVFARMAPGSAASGHQAALLFAASEYELLSREATDGTDRGLPGRVAEKAAAIRKLAAE
jgi:hypothetical protein